MIKLALDGEGIFLGVSKVATHKNRLFPVCAVDWGTRRVSVPNPWEYLVSVIFITFQKFSTEICVPTDCKLINWMVITICLGVPEKSGLEYFGIAKSKFDFVD